MFVILLNHYIKKLGKKRSFYDTYLLITKDRDIYFGITWFQTNNTFNVGTKAFINKKEVKIVEVKFKAKSQTILEIDVSGDFNGYQIRIEAKSIIVM